MGTSEEDISSLVIYISGVVSVGWLLWTGSSLSDIAKQQKRIADVLERQAGDKTSNTGSDPKNEKPPFWV